MDLDEIVRSAFLFLVDFHLYVMIPIVLYGIFVFNKVAIPFRFIIAYMFCSLFFESAMTIMAVNKLQNIFFIPLSALVEYALLSILYYQHMVPDRRKIIKVSMILFTPLVVVANLFSLSGAFDLQQFHAYGMVVACSAFIFFSVQFIVSSLSNLQQQIDREMLNLNMTILIYNAARLLIFASVNFMMNGGLEFTNYFWTTFVVIVVLFDLRIGYLLWKHGKSRKPLPFGLQ